jgi:hypothetical protein
MRIKRKVVKVVKPKVVKAAVAKKAGLMRTPKRGPASAAVDTAFTDIIAQALSRAGDVEASQSDYQAGLRYMRDEVERALRASGELSTDEDDDY